MEGYSLTVSDIIGQILTRYVDRSIIDQTGLKGTFDIHLESVPAILPQGPVRLNGVDVGNLPPSDNSAPSVFSFVEQQMGLKLAAGKGPVEFLIIAHAEKPSAN